MGISWSIRRDHRGGDTLTLYSRNTSSHLLHYIHPINLSAPNQAECPQFGQTGLWRSYEKAVGVACWKVRFQLFRTVTNDTNPLLVLLNASAIFDAIKRNFATGSFRHEPAGHNMKCTDRKLRSARR